MMNSFGRRLFSRGIASMIGLMGVALMAGCGSTETPVAPGPKEEVKVIGPTLNTKKLKAPVGSRREHQKEQQQAKGAS